jgi:hypothetical protein
MIVFFLNIIPMEEVIGLHYFVLDIANREQGET